MFQFTHPGGVRQCEVATCTNDNGFQFTHPGGVRLLERDGTSVKDYVSIHAPGRGATEKASSRSSMMEFQFTHPGGVRPIRSALGDSFPMFQFTHPGGVRLHRL